MKSVLAYGVIRNGGPQIRWQRPEIEVVERDTFNNTGFGDVSVSIVQRGNTYSVATSGEIQCEDYNTAVKLYDEMCDRMSHDGPVDGDVDPLYESSVFDGGPVDASEWPF